MPRKRDVATESGNQEGRTWSSSVDLRRPFSCPRYTQQTLAMETLVRDRCDELGLKPVELVRRCGYQNASKGLRRLEQLRAGDFASTTGLLRTLPAALQLPVDVVEEAIQATQRYQREAAEAAWRAAFRPHAVIITERTIPQPIFVACMIGVDTLLRVDFDPVGDARTYVSQSINGILHQTQTVEFVVQRAGGILHPLVAGFRPANGLRRQLFV